MENQGNKVTGRTTSEMMTELISQRGWWRNCGMTEDQGNNYRARFKAGKLSAGKMDEILTAAGFKVVQEKLWA